MRRIHSPVGGRHVDVLHGIRLEGHPGRVIVVKFEGNIDLSDISGNTDLQHIDIPLRIVVLVEIDRHRRL